MSKKNEATTTTKTITRAELIKQYRQLGKDMTTLRDGHIKEIEKLIVQYKNDKSKIREQREQLLIQIRTPKAETKAAAEQPKA